MLQPIGFDAKTSSRTRALRGSFREWSAGKDVIVVDDGTTSDDVSLGAIGDIGFVIER